jgi:hypothetical protein
MALEGLLLPPPENLNFLPHFETFLLTQQSHNLFHQDLLQTHRQL